MADTIMHFSLKNASALKKKKKMRSLRMLALEKYYNVFSAFILSADGMSRLSAHQERGHVLGIFFARVAPSGPGTAALCPCPGVLHPNYVLAISRDVGKASDRSVTFSLGLLTGSVHVCVQVCVYMCLYMCLNV